jgi:hypothetical protein
MTRRALFLAAVALSACHSSGAPALPPPAKPGQSAASRVVVWAVGDGADGSDVARRLAGRIHADRPDRFLYLGDVYPNGTARDFRRHYAPVYGRLAEITSPTPGNHEWANRGAGYQPYWRGVTRRAQSYWYSLSLAGWEIVSLSSEAPHDAASPQLRWLRKRLEGPGTCRLAFWHRPRYSAGTVHGDAPDTEPFWRALRGHVRLVVNGHDHLLQRLRRRAGITEFVSGAGGDVLYGRHRDSRLAFARSGVTAGLRIVLEPGRARLKFISVDGEVLDTSEVRCVVAPRDG